MLLPLLAQVAYFLKKYGEGSKKEETTVDNNMEDGQAAKEGEKEEVEAGEEGTVEQKTRDVGPQPMLPVPRRRRSNPPSSA